MANQTYIFCDGATPTNTVVSLSLGTCGNEINFNWLDCDVTEKFIDLTFTLTVASPTILRVYYDYTYTEIWSIFEEEDNTQTFTEIGYVDIPAGVVSHEVSIICSRIEDCTTEDWEYTYEDHELIPQPIIPVCGAPPEGCELEITGNTITAPSIRGDNNGTIYVAISGGTASDSYKLNGVTKDVNGDGNYTFTGLAADSYEVLIATGTTNVVCFTQETYIVPEGEFRTGDFTVVEPIDLTASENPILITLRTAINSVTPLPSKSDFDVDAGINNGDKIIITLTYPQAYTATFYAKGYPDKDNYFLASILTDAEGNTVGSNSLAEIATSLAEVFNNDSVINRLYFIRVDDNVVYLEAKENNPNLNLDSNTVSIVGDIDLTINQAGVSAFDGQLESNYSLYVDLNIDTNSQYGDILTVANFNKITELELPFDKSNNHQFDLSDVLKNFVSTPKIDFTITGATSLSSMMASYYINYGEKYPLIPNSTTKKKRSKGTTGIKHVINSALEWEDENTMADYLGDYIHDIKAGFSGTFSGSIGNQTFVFDDIYFSTGTTANTTNVQFKIDNQTDSQVFDWQDSITFNGITSDSASGLMYISGITSGNTFLYEASWYSNDFSSNITTNSIDYINNIKFLTNAPNPKFIQRNSNEFLYIILKKNYGRDLTIKANMYFFNGTSLTGQTLYVISSSGTNNGGVYCVPSGYEQLGLEDYETYSGGTRKIRKLEFAIFQTDDANIESELTEVRNYRYEIDELVRRYGVAFLNKRGTWDIFDFTGEIVNTVEHQNKIYQVPRLLDGAGASPKGFQSNTVYNTKVVKSIACNTGWINLDTFNWLIELLSSNRIYNYTDSDQPFLITSSIDYNKSSNDDLYQIDVVFTETLEENNISV